MKKRTLKINKYFNKMVKIFIIPSSKQRDECISLAKALNGKHGCDVMFTAPHTTVNSFTNLPINCVPFNSIQELEHPLIINKFSVCITFDSSHETKNPNIFSIKVRGVNKGEYTFDTPKGIIKSSIVNDEFKVNSDGDIPILTTIYKNYSPNNIYMTDNTQILMRGQMEVDNNIPTFNYTIKDYSSKNNDCVTIKPLCNWESSVDMFNDFKRFTKDGKGRWNNLLMDPNATNPDYYMVFNSTNEKFDPSKTMWFCMEPKMETNIGWKAFCEYMNNANPLFNGSHSLQMNNVEWHLSKSYSELLDLKIEKKFDKVLSVVVSDRCVDEGHKLRLDFIKDLDSRASSTSLFGLKSNNTLGFDVHIYGKCKSLNFKNYKGELPKASKEDGIFPYKYHFNAENHSYDNYITEKFTDGVVGETVFFYWGCPNAEKYYNPQSFIRLSLKPEDRETDIKLIKDAMNADEWGKRINIIKEEKTKMLKVYNMFSRMESIISLKDTTILVENLNNDTLNNDRVMSIVKQNFKDIKLVGINKGMKVYIDVFNFCVSNDKNIILLFKDTDISSLHHSITTIVSSVREIENDIVDIIMLDEESFFITPKGAKNMLDHINKLTGPTSFEDVYKNFLYKKVK
jgi:hypothetical protein